MFTYVFSEAYGILAHVYNSTQHDTIMLIFYTNFWRELYGKLATPAYDVILSKPGVFWVLQLTILAHIWQCATVCTWMFVPDWSTAAMLLAD